MARAKCKICPCVRHSAKRVGAGYMNVLVIDDDAALRRTLRTSLESFGHEAAEARDSHQALEILGRRPFEAALLDLRLAEELGLDLLPQLLALAPGLHVVVVTAYATIETAVEAMRRGAFDYLAKPFTPDQLRVVLDRIARIRRLQSQVDELEERVRSVVPEIDLQTNEPTMREVLEVAFKTAASEATILLRGESGTGKGVLAQAIHARSPRAAGPFVTVHCPSLSGELLESELFGHVQGASPARYATRWARRAWRRGARSSSMKSATSPWLCSPSCCGCSRNGATSGSEKPAREPATFASWRPPTTPWKAKSRRAASAKTCSTDST